MSAPTRAVRRALAQAGEKGLAHLAAQQNTGTWISRCGRQIRGRDIRAWDGDAAGTQAEVLGTGFCAECRAEAIQVAGTVVDGVGILLRLDPADASAPQLLDVPLYAIGVDGAGRDADEELIASVRANGVRTPIVARRTAQGLRLVDGRRRYAAAAAACLETIPTIVRELDEQTTVVDQLLANLHRRDLDPIAQAHAYVDALEVLEVSKQDLADGLGLSRSQVSNTIRLLALPPHLQEHVASGTIKPEQARELLRLTPDEQDAHADRILADRAARAARAGHRPAVDPRLTGAARLLGDLFSARVRIGGTAKRRRIVIDVDGDDLPRVLEQLGITSASVTTH